MSVVTKNIPDGTIYGGSPAKFCGYVNEEWIECERQKFECEQ